MEDIFEEAKLPFPTIPPSTQNQDRTANDFRNSVGNEMMPQDDTTRILAQRQIRLKMRMPKDLMTHIE